MRWPIALFLVFLLSCGTTTIVQGQTDALDEANRLHQQALDLHKQSKYAEALPLYQRALALQEKALGSDHPIVAISLNNLAVLHKTMGDYAQALPLFQRALAIHEKVLGPDHPDTANNVSNLAGLYQEMGDYAQALPLSQRALALLEKVLGREHPSTAGTLYNLALLYREMRNTEQAFLFAQRALTIREKVLGPEHPDTAATLAALAGIYQLKGDYAQALQLFRKGLVIREKVLGSKHPDTAASLNDLATVYADIGDYEQAKTFYQQALAIWEKTLGPDHPNTILAIANLATVQEPLALFSTGFSPKEERVLALREKTLGPNHPDVARALENLAAVYLAYKEPQKALPLYQRAVKIWERNFGPDNPDRATALNNLAAVYEALNQETQALEIHQQVLAVREAILGPEHLETAKTLASLARINARLGKYEMALSLFKRSFAAKKQVVDNVFRATSEKQKLQFLQQLTDDYIAALWLVSQYLSSDTQAVRWSLELVLQWKGIVLDVEARTQQALAATLTGDALQSWQRLMQNRSELSHLLLTGPGEKNLEDYRKAIQETRATIAQEEKFISQHSNLGAQVITPYQVTVLRVVQALPRNSALVEFVGLWDVSHTSDLSRSTKYYLAFVLTSNNQLTLIKLGAADRIDAAVHESLATIDNLEFRINPKAYSHKVSGTLSELYRLVFAPLLSVAESRTRIIVSPDGELNKVPFAALQMPSGHHLIEHLTISYVASGRDLLRSGSNEKVTTNLLLVANPAFDDQEVLYQTKGSEEAVRAGDYGERFEPLPGTKEEARIIPTLLSGAQQVLQGKYATESALRSAKPPKVLHLATHGFFLKDEENPPPDLRSFMGDMGLSTVRGKEGVRTIPVENERVTPQVNPMVRSGLALAGANHAKEVKSGYDGLLTALEVSGMNLYSTDLVVLSACETGVGDIQVGEGVYGLRRAFVLAGAKNLVMSLWAVNDKITLQQMEEFYRGYAAGKSPAVALRNAQLKSIAALREQTKATLGEPFAPVRLWAPFIVQQTAENSRGETLITANAEDSIPTFGEETERGKGGMQQLPTEESLTDQAQDLQQTPKPEPVSLEVEKPDGGSGYQRWNLIVPLLAFIGLFILSRARFGGVTTDREKPLPTPQEQKPTVSVQAATLQSAPYARFVCQQPNAGLPREIALVHDDVVIGSGTDCDVILRHPSVARQHTRLQWRKQGYILTDLQSAAGTYVNGRRITENLLKDGWTVRFGEIEFVFYEATRQY
jgi:CHAT domain-containing protein/Tfp pilus assembly protein PilF